VILFQRGTLSQQAAATLSQPAVVDAAENGVIQVTTPVQVGAWQRGSGGNFAGHGRTGSGQPIALGQTGLSDCARLWLPGSLQEEAAQLGPTIQAQTPPDFSLVG
jgi:hypothetical protein